MAENTVQGLMTKLAQAIENGEINTAKKLMTHAINQEFGIVKSECVKPKDRLSVPSQIYDTAITEFDKEKRTEKPRDELGREMKKLGFTPENIIESLWNTNYNNVEELGEYMKERFQE